MRADLHVHTSASIDEIDFLGKRTIRPLLSPLRSYHLAKERGMSYVTFTDHDTIDGCLALCRDLGRMPEDFFISVEISSQDPITGKSVHVNAYDITREQHERTQRLRGDLPALAQYLRSQGVLYAWNHPVWEENGRSATIEDLDRLTPLFDTVEVRNGTRRKNLAAVAERIAAQHGKARTAGSDSHTDGIGTTYTDAPGTTLPQYLAHVRMGHGVAGGEHGTSQRFIRDARLLAKLAMSRRENETAGKMRKAGGRLLHALVPALVVPGVHVYHWLQDRRMPREMQGA